MTNSKKKGSGAGSTQKFTEIVDIIEDIVVLQGNNAAIVIEVEANNFALLSQEEQHARIGAYGSLLNSLTFPIQILIRNKKIDVSSYVSLLTQQASQSTVLHPQLPQGQNQKIIDQIGLYRDFVQDLVKVNTVLDKKFYIVISYSHYEQGATLDKNAKRDATGFFTTAKAALHTKADTIHTQLVRLSLKSSTLTKEQLIKLFYDIYNPTQNVPGELVAGEKAAIVKANP